MSSPRPPDDGARVVYVIQRQIVGRWRDWSLNHPSEEEAQEEFRRYLDCANYTLRLVRRTWTDEVIREDEGKSDSSRRLPQAEGEGEQP